MVRGLPSRGRWSVGSSVAPTCQTAVSWPLARVTDRAYGVAGEIPGNLMDRCCDGDRVDDEDDPAIGCEHRSVAHIGERPPSR